MGHIKDITNQSKTQSFPSSTYEIAGEVPPSQCSDAIHKGNNATTSAGPPRLLDPAANFTPAVVGNICTIVSNPGGNTGDFDIFNRSATSLGLVQNPGNGGPTEYYVHNGGELILTRNLKSFADFISAAGYSYTIKGAKLYTNIPSAQLQNACTILFAPLT